MPDVVSVSTTIEAPPQVVYDLVSDLPRMGEWSPENTGGRWLGDDSGPRVGARFKGRNRNGARRWSTIVTVIEATPGEAFAFDVSALGLPVAQWRYRITPSGTGCDVTETWTDKRAPGMGLIGRLGSGVSDRKAFSETSMRTTLARLKAAAEAG